MDAMVQKAMKQDRSQELKRMLEERHREIVGDLHHKMRDVRHEDAATSGQGVRDEVESSEAESQDDLEFALLQMKTETLKTIRKALARLEEGSYGYCDGCGKEIAEPRLRALPFAVRCKSCEEFRETARARVCASRDSMSRFAEQTSRVDSHVGVI